MGIVVVENHLTIAYKISFFVNLYIIFSDLSFSSMVLHTVLFIINSPETTVGIRLSIIQFRPGSG